MEDKKVYVVRKDSYDKWGEHTTQILAIFTTKELAEEYMEKLDRDDNKNEYIYYKEFILDKQNT